MSRDQSMSPPWAEKSSTLPGGPGYRKLFHPLCSAAPSSKRMGLDTLLKFRVCVRLNCVRVHPGDKPYGGLSA